MGLCISGMRVLAKGSKCSQGGEVTSATSVAAVGSTSISAMPSQLLSYSAPPCTELGLDGPMRGQLASGESGGASGCLSGEQTSSQVLQLLGQKAQETE